jgi:hypothetical protein
MVTFLNKESITTKLTLIIVGLTAGSGLLIPATYASFHPVTSGEIADGTIRSIDISNTDGVRSADIVNGQVTTADIGAGQVRTEDIADGTIAYGDLSRSLIAVEHRDDCNCGGTGWDPDGFSAVEVIYDDRITPNSVVSVTMISNDIFVCHTDAPRTGSVDVVCNMDIPQGDGVNFAIFNNPAYG